MLYSLCTQWQTSGSCLARQTRLPWAPVSIQIRVGDFGVELSEASKLNRFKGFVEITIGQVHADFRIADEFHVAYAMNIGDSKRQVMRSLQGCLVCGRSDERTHCHDCGALYCSREHQKEDWPRHKSYCKADKEHRHRVHTNFRRIAKNKGWAQIWYGVIDVPHPWATNQNPLETKNVDNFSRDLCFYVL